MMESLKILSFNVNGLGNYHKRKDVFDYLRKQKAHIIFLQETHLQSEYENMIRSMWGFECIVNGKDSNSKGVAILINNTFEYKLHNVVKDANGTYIIIDIGLLDKRMTLVNVYGPSGTDSPLFFETLSNEVESIDNEYVIIGGDWNVALDVQLDVFRYKCVSRPRARRRICDMMDVLDLIDIWRDFNPNKRQYTWRRFNSTQQGRLDYFLISEQLTSNVAKVAISPGYRSDHSIVSLELKTDQHKRQRPYWKFNNTLLKDKGYVNEVKNVIIELKQQYCALVYCHDNIHKVKNEDLQLTINDQLFFEMILLEIRGKSIAYAAHKKKEDVRIEEILTKEISELEEDVNEDNLVILENKRIELEALRKKKIDGLIVRSRAKWIEEGEKNSKYFSNLEKRNYVEKSMTYIETDDGMIISDPEKIREQVKIFYENLYSSREAELVNVDLSNVVNGPKLSSEQSDSVEGVISYKEALEALKVMKNNRSPGTDGYSTEFFKFFWIDLGVFLVRSFNYGFNTGQLSVTQRQGIITCIPKEGKSKKFLKNWRPITLLNTAYKIVSACIAQRLKSVLPHIIHEDQKGFLPGRFIGENHRMLYDLLVYTDLNNIPGLLLLIDFEKAFDSVAWTFIEKCLDFFNFGVIMKQWIRLFYNNVMSCVGVNGGYSSWFRIFRGCRQGDPCSPYIYLICAEILSLLIRSNKDIQGIKIVDDVKVLLSQFADDTSLYLDGSKKSFEQSVITISYFASISGLHMNFEKTQVVWIGSRKNSNLKYMPEFNFIWNPVNFKVLGVTYSTNVAEIVHLNYNSKLEDIRRLLMMWSRRHLTPFGKITVIKTLALSKLVYLFSNIPDPPAQFFQDLDKMFFDFLWDKKRSKIKRSVVCAAYEKGGLRMIDVVSFAASMKISWLRRIFSGHSLLYRMLCAMCPDAATLPTTGGEFANIIIRRCKNTFWHDVMKHYKKFCVKCSPEDDTEFVSECIHYNINIVMAKKTVHINEWMDNNILRIGDIVDENGYFYSFDDFQHKYPMLHTNFLTYYGVTRAITAYKNKLDMSIDNNFVNNCSKAWTSILYGGNRVVYSTLVGTHVVPRCIEKWTQHCTYQLNWENVFMKLHKSTSDMHLRWFQIRLLHRILPTQRYLFLMKIADSPLCTFCGSEQETILHLLWDCRFVQRFWADLLFWLNDKCTHCANFTFSESLVLFGWKQNCKTDKIMDLMILLGKYHIYKCKIQNKIPSTQYFKQTVRQRYVIEKYAHAIAGKIDRFLVNWAPYMNLLN